MHTLRIPIAGFAGALSAASLFWLLSSLITTSYERTETVDGPIIDFTHLIRDTEVETRRRDRIVREPTPPTPETPRIAFTGGGVDNHVVRLTPVVDTGGGRSRITMAAGSDRDVIPLVRVNPDYPQSAINRQVEGWVQVQFTITAAGTVQDAIVVDALPRQVFEDAALKAIVRWRYNPKVESGAAVERVGVQTRIVFTLQ